MSEERIVSFTVEEFLEKLASGELKSKTDWVKFDAVTDEELERRIAEDPDADILDPDWANAVAVPATKTPISIRLDDDVLAALPRDTKGHPHLAGDPRPLPAAANAALAQHPVADASGHLFTILLSMARARQPRTHPVGRHHAARLTARAPLLPRRQSR